MTAPGNRNSSSHTSGRRAAGRLLVVASIAGVLVAAALGALAGSTLGERMSEPGTETLTLLDPALAPESGPALQSPGGFTGFEGAPALTGRVFRTGTFEVGGEGEMRVAGSGGSLDLELDGGTRLLQLGPAASPLAPDDLVVVRLEDDRVLGILRVPADLREDAPPN